MPVGGSPSIFTLEFPDFTFEGRNIHYVLTPQGWEQLLSWVGPYLLIVQEFYATLVDVDTDIEKWQVVMRGVSVISRTFKHHMHIVYDILFVISSAFRGCLLAKRDYLVLEIRSLKH